MAGDEHEAHTPPFVAAAEAAFDRVHEKHVAAATTARNESLTNWLEAFEAEHAAVLQQVLPDILAHPDTPPIVRDVLGAITNPAHQTQALLGMAAVYAIISGFVSAAIGPAIASVAQAASKLDPNYVLSPQEMAVAVNRGWVERGAAAAEAEKSGINGSRFDILTAIVGNPPGPDALMQALRRGIIDQGRFEHGIRESNIRPEWIDVMFALRHSPVGAGTVIAGAVEGHLTHAEAAHRLDLAGIDPDNFQWLYETAGRPPGIHEMLELVNRGELSETVMRQAIRESDIKNKYVDDIIRLRRKIPPMRTLVAAVHQGVLTEAKAVHMLQQLGYNEEDAAMLAKEGTNRKHETNKALTQATVVRLYAERLIPRAKAETMLADLGYDTTETGFLLALSDHARAETALRSAVNRVHNRYVGFKLDRSEARTALDRIGVHHEARDDLLGAWDDERAANTPLFSVAQIQGLAHRKIINQQRFQDEAMKLGWAKNDVHLLWELAWPATQTAPEWKL